MKLHIGVDSAFGLIYTLTTTPANVHDITVAEQLLHGEEDHVIGDAGYTGIEKREEHQEREVDWMTAARRVSKFRRQISYHEFSDRFNVKKTDRNIKPYRSVETEDHDHHIFTIIL